MFNSLKTNHQDLFVYLKADKVHRHDIFLDKVLLRFLPKSVTPNQLTAFRIIMTPFVFFIVLNEYFVPGFILFLLVAFTDAMDGSMARTQNKITRFGMLFDPLADKLLVGSMVLLLVFGYYHYLLGATIIGMEVFVVGFVLFERKGIKIVRKANIWGKMKMIFQVIAMSLTMIALIVQLPILFSIAFWFFIFAVIFAFISIFGHGI